MTQHDDGVIMYHGPVTDQLQPGQDTDFILLEMRNGFPMLRVDHGSGRTDLTVNTALIAYYIVLRKVSFLFYHCFCRC